MINPIIRAYVQASVEVFRKYEELHEAKCTIDGMAKAAVNRAFAERGEEVLKLIDSMGD